MAPLTPRRADRHQSPTLMNALYPGFPGDTLGCRAIAGECGYFAYFQKDITACVNIPVFMSSLLQVPFAQQLIRPNQVIGILVFSKDVLSDTHLEAVGIQPGSNYVIEGVLESGLCPELTTLYMLTDPADRSAAVGMFWNATFCSRHSTINQSTRFQFWSLEWNFSDPQALVN